MLDLMAVITVYTAEYAFASLLVYPIIWLVIGQKHGPRLRIGAIWQLAGLLGTALSAAIIKFLITLVIGGRAVHTAEGGFEIFMILGPPILAAIAVCLFLRTKAIPTEAQKSNC